MSLPTRDEKGRFPDKPLAKKELVKEQSGTQISGNPFLEWAWATQGTVIFANGGTMVNPMAFPGYNSLYTGAYTTYRWMLQHPILRLVRSISVAAIVASKWEYVKTDPSVPQADLDMVKRNLDPIRNRLLTDFYVRGRDYGWMPGEPIWEVRGGETRLIRVKPLLPDSTIALKDEWGNFVGLKNFSGTGSNSGAELPGDFKAWKFTYDSEAGYMYGRSWLENVRNTAWKDWLDCAQQMQKLSAKIAGTQMIIKSPAGTFPGPDGKSISYRDNAIAVIKAIQSGAAGAWFPSLGIMPDAKGNLDAMKVIVELAGKSLTTIDVVDFSGNTTAIAPLLERMKHAEELMFAGGLRPSRAGLEAQHGAKADAETHTDTATINAENDDVDFADQCQPLVDAIMVVNRGDEAKGKIRIQSPSLVDRKSAMYKAILLALISQPQIANEFVATANMDDIMDFIEICRKKGFDVDAMQKAIEAQKPQAPAEKQKGSTEPHGGRPTKE